MHRGKWPVAAAAIIAVGAVALLVGLAIDRSAHSAAYREARSIARNDAAILATGLQAELDKFSLVPLVLADDPEVQAVLEVSTRRSSNLNRRFEALARQTKAAAIYLMDDHGMTLAASNWREPTSFVGADYNFRRYFREALAQGSSKQFALGRSAAGRAFTSPTGSSPGVGPQGWSR